MFFNNPRFVSTSGNDTDGTTLANAYNTVLQAYLEQLGDTSIDAILIDDGTYDEDYNFIIMDDVFIGPVNPGDGTNVVLTNSANTRTIRVGGSTNNITFGRLTIDVNGQQTGVRGPTTAGTNLNFTFVGTRIINYTTRACELGGSTYFTGEYLFESLSTSSASSHGILWEPDADNRNLYMGPRGVINMAGSSANSINGVQVIAAAGTRGHNVHIGSGLSITCAPSNTGCSARGVFIGDKTVAAGFGCIYIGSFSLTLSGSTEPMGVVINADETSAEQIEIITINNPSLINTTESTLAPTGGYGINIGGEWDASTDTLGQSNLGVYESKGAIIDGFDHGAYFGGLLNKANLASGYKISNCVTNIIEGCVNCYGNGAVIFNPNSNGDNFLRFKDSQACFWDNNTLISTDVNFSGTFLRESDDLNEISDNNKFRNNNCIVSAGHIGAFTFSRVDVAGGTINGFTPAQFENNHYYKGGDAFGASDFDFQGTTYDLTGWQTNVSASDFTTVGDPQVILVTGALEAGSPLETAGVSIDVIGESNDFWGSAFSFTRPVGAFIANSEPECDKVETYPVVADVNITLSQAVEDYAGSGSLTLPLTIAQGGLIGKVQKFVNDEPTGRLTSITSVDFVSDTEINVTCTGYRSLSHGDTVEIHVRNATGTVYRLDATGTINSGLY